MAIKKRRQFKRLLGERRYKKLFIISTEGNVTENDYFGLLNSIQSKSHCKLLTDRTKSAPGYVLDRIKIQLENEAINKTDEAWIVVDRDLWKNEQLQELFAWSQSAENYGLALSNPCFEYWLLIHFENGDNIKNADGCKLRLKNYLPDYKKSIKTGKITIDHIQKAVDKARTRDNPPCRDWPRDIGNTTLY